MFLSYKTTENTKKLILDVTFLPILPTNGYSHIYDLFILLFNTVHTVHLGQYFKDLY